MISKIDTALKKRPFLRRTLEAIMVLFMALYPLRHIHIGLDLWDTGYNYANFEYMGLDSMDSMWFFSTFLSTAVGHLLTLLPFGKTVLGLNFYTGLIVSIMAVASYMFCTRIIKLPKFIVFLGEYVAISLCWCPTALLYNYLTYFFMLVAVVCIYMGLTRNRNHWLFLAGVALGINLFVRFSNLPEVVFIFAVWVYGILEVRSRHRAESDVVKKRERKNGFKRTAFRTLACMLGYFSVVGGMLLYFGIRYGFGSYFEAIKRLFSMTEEAQDYTAASMLRTLINWYVEAGYWVSRLCVFAVGGVLVCALAKHLDIQYEINIKGKRRHFTFLRLAYIISILLAALSLAWLYKRKFSFGHYGEYGSMLLPSAVLLFLTVIVGVIQIFMPKNSLEKRLIAGLALIVVLITPIGSNTGIFPIINNQFLVAPFLIYSIWKLLRIKDGEGISRYNFNNPLIDHATNKRKKITEIVWSYVSLFPVKAVILAFAGLCLVQFTTFGAEFVFTESHNAWDTYYSVANVKTVRGIRMNYEKATDFTELQKYIRENGLNENELITYGNIPAVSFYLQMTPAFNTWIDLSSYNASIMEQDLNTVLNESEAEYMYLAGKKTGGKPEVIKDNIVNNENAEGEAEAVSRSKVYPVIIVAAQYADYLEAGAAEDAMNDEGLDEIVRNNAEKIAKDAKWKLLTGYISEAGYRLEYVNGTYAVLVAANEVPEQ